MSSSDSEDEIPISALVAGKATPKNGKNGAAREPAAPAGDEAPAPAKAKPARAPTTTEAIFDEPDSDDDVPIGQMTKQNGAAKAEPAEAPPPKPKPKPKTTTEAIFDEPES